MDNRKPLTESMKNTYEHKSNSESEKLNPKFSGGENCELQDFQGMDRGDSGRNNTSTSIKNYQYLQCLASGEGVTPNPPCQCKSHQEPQQVSHVVYSEKSMQFTPEMIRDQEQLVTMMSQRGMSEVLIRRQFERLLDEQSKQLRLMEGTKSSERKGINETSRYEQRSKPAEVNEIPARKPQDNNCHPGQTLGECTTSPYSSQIHASHCQKQEDEMQERQIAEEMNAADQMQPERDNPRKIEPSSLLKIRLKKEANGLQGRNNGLQAPDEAVEIIKRYKYTRSSRRNCGRTNTEPDVCVRLNGTQNRSDIECLSMHKNLQKPLDKQTPANGLENQRNPSNPATNLKSYRVRHCADQEYSCVYPQQKCQMSYRETPPKSYRHPEPEETCQPTRDAVQPSQPETHAAAAQPGGNYVCTENDNHFVNENHNMTFSSQFQEPKIIGGFTYFARKPECMPNVPGFLYDNYSRISHSKPATAF